MRKLFSSQVSGAYKHPLKTQCLTKTGESQCQLTSPFLQRTQPQDCFFNYYFWAEYLHVWLQIGFGISARGPNAWPRGLEEWWDQPSCPSLSSGEASLARQADPWKWAQEGQALTNTVYFLHGTRKEENGYGKRAKEQEKCLGKTWRGEARVSRARRRVYVPFEEKYSGCQVKPRI